VQLGPYPQGDARVYATGVDGPGLWGDGRTMPIYDSGDRHMTAATPDAARSMRGPVLFWAMLASLALGYLAVLTLKPELVGSVGLRADAVAMATAPGAVSTHSPSTVSTAAASGEIETLRQTVARIETDLADMKAMIATGEERDRAILARLPNIEGAPVAAAPAATSPIVTGSIGGRADAPVAGVASAEPGTAADKTADAHASATAAGDTAPAPKGDARRVASAPPLKGAVDAGGPSPARDKTPDARKKHAAAPAHPEASAEIVPSFTAAVTPAPPPAAAPKIISRANSYGVQLASGPSLDTLRISWALLNDRHSSLLKGLEPRYASTNDPDANMALLAGPMPTAEAAARVCANLRAKRITCSVVSFDGKAL
jgi:hypothetical protein